MPHIILDLCGGTGSWSKPYKDAGYDVRIIEIRNGNDVRIFQKPKEKIHGILAAPPCTHFCSSGARWWEKKGESALLDGLAVVDACLRIIYACQPEFWALENPVGRLVHYMGAPVMWFQPWEYGDPYTKKTGIWGKFSIPEKELCEPLPNIAEDGHNNPIKRFLSKMHLLPPTSERAILRSITPP